ncbi:PIN domain-containing protein [Cupriavidus cauae]|uniref:PIN domain-containing protein n=1 Tax=Cupriavidus cauae TaxID=2608999 RepID=UPI0022445780|nr:PIN domain-containing protein [Cupriavidus cauae]UZN51310.1 PIN domain-containing protein [Cupriavidus cauae]
MREPKGSAFIDSNVVLYLLSEDARKANRSEALLRTRPTISVQVLNEVTSVCVRKLDMAWHEIADLVDAVKSFCTVVPLTVDIHDSARRLAERHGFAFYDACIVATASMSGCQILYTEDMHDGLIVEDGLTIRNPFL